MGGTKWYLKRKIHEKLFSRGNTTMSQPSLEIIKFDNWETFEWHDMLASALRLNPLLTDKIMSDIQAIKVTNKCFFFVCASSFRKFKKSVVLFINKLDGKLRRRHIFGVEQTTNGQKMRLSLFRSRHQITNCNESHSFFCVLSPYSLSKWKIAFFKSKSNKRRKNSVWTHNWTFNAISFNIIVRISICKSYYAMSQQPAQKSWFTFHLWLNFFFDCELGVFTLRIDHRNSIIISRSMTHHLMVIIVSRSYNLSWHDCLWPEIWLKIEYMN